MTAPTTTRVTRPSALIAAPLGFLIAYLVVSPVSDALADRPLPLPGTGPSEVAAYFAANPAAVAASALLQVASVACLAVFIAALAPVLRGAGPEGARVPLLGYVAVAAIVVSSLLAGAAAVVASRSAGVTYVLREASFYAGGVAHVVTLGAFVLGAALILGRRELIGVASRWSGYVAGALAMLSIVSLGVYYASVLLPVGRVLSMVATVAIGVALVRGRRSAR